jgi:hypothetical protein
MKKLSILLIGLLLVTGIAFADFGDVEIDGSASVTFGVDLNTNYTGFANAGSSSITITLVDEADAEATGDDGVYGTITIEEFEVLIEDDTISATLGDVSASITVEPAVITIYTAPDMSLDMAPTIDSGVVEGDIAVGISNVNGADIGGVTISIPAGPADIDLKVASDGDWTDNMDNDYAIGADVSVEVGPATVDVGFLYGWFTNATMIGVSFGAEVDVAPATITFGFDGDASVSGSFEFDIAAGASVDLADPNEDDDATNVYLDAYVYTGGAEMDVDLVLGFEEFEDGGLMDMLYATATIELLDLVAALEWNVDVAGGYDTGDVDPYFGFGYGSDSIFDLNVGVVLKEGLTGIDNTSITIDYVSTDLSVDNGVITVEAEVSL